MSFEHDLEARLRALANLGLHRAPDPAKEGLLDFASNDYLGIGARRRAVTATGSARASRLVRGDSPEVRALESRVAEWLGTGSALVFASGYAANVGVISALAEKGDLIVSDALNHASIIDGCRLSGAAIHVAPHLCVLAARETLLAHRATGRGRRWIVTESYFGMDADRPDLASLRVLADECDAGLLVDEAHAFGARGPQGRGELAAAGVRADAVVGTFGKALGGGGAFVAGSALLIEWLWNRARSFVFSTGMSPVLALATRAAFEEALAGDALRQLLEATTTALRQGLMSLGRGELSAPLGEGAVIPIAVRDVETAVAIQLKAREVGLHVQAIRPPTASPRLRLSAHASLRYEDVSRLLSFLKAERFT